MSEPVPDIYEEDELLAKAARMDFSAMQHVHTHLLESEAPETISTLALAYSRFSRCLRLNIAKLQKQKADREKARREREAWEAGRRRHEPDPHEAAVEERTAEVQQAVDRVISATAAGDEALHTDWCHRFDREVDDWNEQPDWLEDDLDTVVTRVCKALGLPDEHAANWRQLPDPTFFPEPEETTPEEEAEISANLRDATARYLAARSDLRDGQPPPKPPWRNSG